MRRKEECIWSTHCDSGECEGCQYGSKFKIEMRTVRRQMSTV